MKLKKCGVKNTIGFAVTKRRKIMTEAKLRDISAFVDHRKEILDGVREVRCFKIGRAHV